MCVCVCVCVRVCLSPSAFIFISGLLVLAWQEAEDSALGGDTDGNTRTEEETDRVGIGDEGQVVDRNGGTQHPT